MGLEATRSVVGSRRKHGADLVPLALCLRLDFNAVHQQMSAKVLSCGHVRHQPSPVSKNWPHRSTGERAFLTEILRPPCSVSVMQGALRDQSHFPDSSLSSLLSPLGLGEVPRCELVSMDPAEWPHPVKTGHRCSPGIMMASLIPSKGKAVEKRSKETASQIKVTSSPCEAACPLQQGSWESSSIDRKP
jgi:hypothetical protein